LLAIKESCQKAKYEINLLKKQTISYLVKKSQSMWFRNIVEQSCLQQCGANSTLVGRKTTEFMGNILSFLKGRKSDNSEWV
jgi:hypothetical protein